MPNSIFISEQAKATNEIVLCRTQSPSPVNFKVIPAEIVQKGDKIYIQKRHKNYIFRTLLENDPKLFKGFFKTWEFGEFYNLDNAYAITNKDWKKIKEEKYTIFLMVTGRCNSSCRICFVYGSSFIPEELKIEDIKEFLSKIGKGKKIVLCGGEPTIREDLFNIIDMIHKSGNITELYTNGLRLEDPTYVEKLAKSGIKKIYFSFDGFAEEIYEKLRGNKNYLYTKLKALRNLESSGIRVILTATIASGINDNQIPYLLRFAIKNNNFIKGLYLYGATPYGRFNITIDKYLTPSDLIKLLEKASQNKIRREYFLEWSRFIKNINLIFNKFGLYFYRSYFISNPYYKIENNNLKEYIPCDELKKINDTIERGKLFLLFKYSFKYFKRFLRMFFSPTKVHYKILEENILSIRAGNINNPLIHLPLKQDALEIMKSDTIGWAAPPAS
jgi:uncharacterized radical SAM superfamily Fe-S cluster-containing enzyme